MTREEALDILHHNWTRIDNPNYKEEELDEAFFMAIEALSADAMPTVIRSRTLLPTKDFKEWAKRVRETNPNVIVIPCDSEVVSADAVQGWIPCSERLPSESDYYFVTNINAFEEKEVCVIWFAHKRDYGVSEWREITDEDTILAWMPLPKPYREDGE